MSIRDSLNNYIRSVRDMPFSWGQHDCLTFTNNAFKAMYGSGWADDWIGRYDNQGSYVKRTELEKEFGFKIRQLPNEIDKKLSPIDYIPPLGALVTTKECQRWITGVAFGISTGTKAVFLSKEGLHPLSLEFVDQAWVKDT